MFNVGDEVEVYSASQKATRNGKVVALLPFPHGGFPVVVEHDVFGCDDESGGKTYQCFNHDGERNHQSHQVTIRHPKKTETVVLNVYPTRHGIDGVMWYTSEKNAATARGSDCIGYFKAERDLKTKKVSDYIFIPLEK